MPSSRVVSASTRWRLARSSSASFAAANSSSEAIAGAVSNLQYSTRGCSGVVQHTPIMASTQRIPGDLAETVPRWYQAGLPHIWLPYAQMKTARPPLPVARTENCRIVLADGRELIDGIASWWTACHGYNHPHIRAAIERQLAVMPHVMFGGLVHEQALTLARRLAALMPGDLDRVFFSDSGSVAVEVAMKMATQYWLNKGIRGRARFLAFRGGYHGDTIGTMALCDPDEGM